MDACKNFSKKYPILLAVLAFALTKGLLQVTGKLLPDFPLRFGIRELIIAVIIMIVTILFMGKEKVSFSLKGLGYAFRSLRGYYIFMICVTVFTVTVTIIKNAADKQDTMADPIKFISILLGCFCVGIVAALISGMIFGAAHVMDSVLDGEIVNSAAATTAILKTSQCAIFGIILCFIYYKTRNLFAVAILHFLDDFMLMVHTSIGSFQGVSYVGTDKMALRVGAYLLFTLILVPNLVKAIKNVKAGEAIPFDEDFLPRKVEFEKKSKKNKAAR